MNLQNKISSLVSKDAIFDIEEDPIVKWCFDDAYYGGNCITIKGNSNHKYTLYVNKNVLFGLHVFLKIFL